MFFLPRSWMYRRLTSSCSSDSRDILSHFFGKIDNPYPCKHRVVPSKAPTVSMSGHSEDAVSMVQLCHKEDATRSIIRGRRVLYEFIYVLVLRIKYVLTL